ncbi:hypothetical protein HMN09_00906900 [Mycena chlorophos]|uniref:F-box domain-containing protein n=1 Tax=Mycena chlorophos TaxID=658473 RepID=A0A8H6SMW2_MYCCL|nr:hypothetical protein HMN09_00906900 [Mycena chlorophos]
MPLELEAQSTETPEPALSSKCYPVSTLPVEIIAEIFQAFLPSYPDAPTFNDKFASPFALGHICGQWRRIALSTPSLWRAVRIPSSDIHIEKLTSSVEAIRCFLDRSDDYSLSIQIYGTPRHGHVAAMFDAILPYAPRFQFLTLDVDAAIADQLFVTEMPLLRGVEVVGWPENRGDLQDGPPISFLKAPLLSGLSIWDLKIGTPLPYMQFTALNFMVYPPPACALVLEHTHNLVFLRLCLQPGDAITSLPVLP